MKGTPIMRFVGNRQTPEESPFPVSSDPDFSQSMLYPLPPPRDILQMQEDMFEMIHALSCPFYKEKP